MAAESNVTSAALCYCVCIRNNMYVMQDMDVVIEVVPFCWCVHVCVCVYVCA